jgi:hypothetical protein
MLQIANKKIGAAIYAAPIGLGCNVIDRGASISDGRRRSDPDRQTWS